MFDQQSLAAHRAAGDRRNEAIAQGNIGAGWLGLGELAQARRELEEGLRLLRVNGERALEVSPLCALSTLALWQGDDAHALVQARAALETAVAVHARDQEAAALCRVGDAESGARAASPRRRKPSRRRMRAPARSPARIGTMPRQGWPGSRWRRATPRRRCRRLAPLLALGAKTGADDNPLEGVEFPRLVEWTCHRVLASAGDRGDPRAAEWLARAHDALQAQAATIADAALRQGFLCNIPVHREIVAAWANAERSRMKGARRATPTRSPMALSTFRGHWGVIPSTGVQCRFVRRSWRWRRRATIDGNFDEAT